LWKVIRHCSILARTTPKLKKFWSDQLSSRVLYLYIYSFEEFDFFSRGKMFLRHDTKFNILLFLLYGIVGLLSGYFALDCCQSNSPLANARAQFFIFLFNFQNQMQTREQICNLSGAIPLLILILLSSTTPNGWLLNFVSKICCYNFTSNNSKLWVSIFN